MFANERLYDALIMREARLQTVPYALIKAVIAQESGFNPRAYRVETAINDASRGLMQLLFRTAKAVGYTGVSAGDDVSHTGGLYDPATNINLGTKLLRDLLKQTGGKVEEAISAYNGGMRPQFGFGARVKVPTRVCLARDRSGVCISYFTAQPGEFGNQKHVERVMTFYRRYVAELPSAAPPPAASGGTAPNPNAPSASTAGMNASLSGRLTPRMVALLVGAAVLLIGRTLTGGAR